MAKFNSESSGWNAGKNYFAHPMRLSDISIDPDISRLFLVKDSTVEEITESIKENDYDKAQPITVWKVNEKKVLLDGHTRYKAAQAAGLDEVPVVEKEFGDKEEALLYAFERQVIRRNLTPDEILTVAEQFMRGRKAKNGKGRAAEIWAARLGISASQLYKAKKVASSGNEKLIEEVKRGEKTITEGYDELTPSKKERMPAPAAAFENIFGDENEAARVYESAEGADSSKAYAISSSDSPGHYPVMEKLDEVIKTLEGIRGNYNSNSSAIFTSAAVEIAETEKLDAVIETLKEIRETTR